MNLGVYLETINFQEISHKLTPYIESIVLINSPGGKKQGNEYMAGNIHGGQGDSFRINLNTGKWADFATGEKGGDIISLYAKIKDIQNPDSARQLSELYLHNKPTISYPVVPPKSQTKIIKPPLNHKFDPPLYKQVKPTDVYTYCDYDGSVMFYICRYDHEENEKHVKMFTPWTFSDNGKWQPKAWPSPRPLYNLDKLHEFPDKAVLIVEGEKAANAAQKIVGNTYIVTTWPNGAQAYEKVDWSPLKNRRVLIWPDSDKPGIEAMSQIAAKISQSCEELKFINTDLPHGHDAADVDFSFEQFKKWATERLQVVKSKTIAEQPKKTEIIHATVEREIKPLNYSMLYLEHKIQTISEKNLNPIPNAANVAKIMSFDEKYKGTIWFDEFYQSIMTNKNSKTPRRWHDADDLELLYYMQTNHNMPKLYKGNASDAAVIYAYANKRNELKDWLLSLEWDGSSRIDNFLYHAYGVEQTDYTTAVSRNWLTGLVARGIRPGCKFDEMLILEGRQGTYKSTSLRVLGGKYFAESNAQLDNKDFMMELAGSWIIEFDELDQFRKAETTLIKKKLSQQTDRYRPAYLRHVVDVPRTCVFVGTTNKEQYLHDETGGRRFWPIRCEKADLDYIAENREQLFAEAVYRIEQLNATWHEMPESTALEQEERRETDPWEEIIKIQLNSPLCEINRQSLSLTINNVAKYVLNIEDNRFEIKDSRRIGRILKALGYKSFVSKDRNRLSTRIYKQNKWD